MNTFGNIYRLTSFGESHGRAMGGVIDGLPAGKVFNLAELQAMLDRRRPGGTPLGTMRSESDGLMILSGIMGWDSEKGVVPLTDGIAHGISLGTPVGFMVANRDVRSSDYEQLRHVYRPSHADYAWDARYGIRDWRGGGRSSGRETLSRVVAGGFAMQLLKQQSIEVKASIGALGGLTNPDGDAIAAAIERARRDADSLGGVVECRVTGLPAGLGEPVFGKLDQMLASAMLSIGGVKGVEFGTGFGICGMRGSEAVDEFQVDDKGGIFTATNHSGGIQGGISNGMDIVMHVAVKPTPTISRELNTVDATGRPVTILAKGRHDPSIVLRVLPVVEAMTAMVILDAMLMKNGTLLP